MKKCKFCETYESLVEMNLESDNRHGLIFLHKTIYEVALVDINKRKERFGKRWVNNGQTTYYGYKLRYCPECGKRV